MTTFYRCMRALGAIATGALSALAVACGGGGSTGADAETDAHVDVATDATDASTDAAMDVDTGPPPPSTLFGPCEIDDQCPGDGAVCRRPEDGWPQGYCTVPCEDRGPCDDGQRYHQCLLGADGEQRFCERYCENGIDCEREGYTCAGDPAAGEGYCIGFCSADEDCGGEAVCNEEAPTCVAEDDLPADANSLGENCSADEDCVSDFCVAELQGPNPTGWTDGYCIGYCILPAGYNTNTFFAGDSLPQAGCAGDAVCYPLAGSLTRGDIGYCLDGCTTDDDCRDDEAYYCEREADLANGSTATYDNGVCMPINCRSGRLCPSGFICNQSRSVCVRS